MWSKGRNTKAQASSAELLIAYFIFFVALTSSVVLWVTTVETVTSRERLDEFEDLAAGIAEKLVRTSGVPFNWTEENVSVIGLTDEPRELSKAKMLSFIRLMNDSAYDNTCLDATLSNYECNKHLVGAGKHDFYLTLEDMNSTVIIIDNITYAAGRLPVDDVESISIARTAIFQENITRMRFTLWHNETGAT